MYEANKELPCTLMLQLRLLTVVLSQSPALISLLAPTVDFGTNLCVSHRDVTLRIYATIFHTFLFRSTPSLCMTRTLQLECHRNAFYLNNFSVFTNYLNHVLHRRFVKNDGACWVEGCRGRTPGGKCIVVDLFSHDIGRASKSSIIYRPMGSHTYAREACALAGWYAGGGYTHGRGFHGGGRVLLSNAVKIKPHCIEIAPDIIVI